MDTTDIIAIIGLVIFGASFGILTARSSNEREALHGNGAARFFHYLSCALISTLAPSVLTMAIVMHPHWVEIGGIWFAPIAQMLGIAFSMLGLAFVFMIPFALLEKPAKEAWEKTQEDRGWTEKDARTSGL